MPILSQKSLKLRDIGSITLSISYHFFSNSIFFIFSKYWGKRVWQHRQLTNKSFWTCVSHNRKENFSEFYIFELSNLMKYTWNVLVLKGCRKHIRFNNLKKKMEFTIVCMCCLWNFAWLTTQGLSPSWIQTVWYMVSYSSDPKRA